MAKDLRSYLDELLEKRPKDVVVVDKEVDPVYGASGIVEKFERKNEFPMVFQNIKGSMIRWGPLGATRTAGIILARPRASDGQRAAHREPPGAGQGDCRQIRAVQEVILHVDAADLRSFTVAPSTRACGCLCHRAAISARARTGAVNVGLTAIKSRAKTARPDSTHPTTPLCARRVQDHNEPMKCALLAPPALIWPPSQTAVSAPS